MNIGVEAPCSVHELATLIAEMTDYTGKICWDTSRPDGAPIRFLNSTEMKKMGWSAAIDLKTGLRRTYDWFLKNGKDPCQEDACVYS